MWKRIKLAFREVWKGAKIGLLLGFFFGFISAKIRDIEQEDVFNFIVLSHVNLGVLLGACMGGIVKLVRLWKEQKKNADNPT